ncbi:adenylosuccinate synthase [Buchnera aphidicola]|uniref:adenylosuccinate synthase n=1 Tax=Buchnera aphidicola TaxID=9 RepID=UPI003464E474
MNKNLVVLGMQWGDEGKGKVIDCLSKKFHYIVRYQGGHNAGHTLLVNDQKIVLHLIPSGVLHKHTKLFLGNGVVISPIDFIKEIDILSSYNISLENRLFISRNCFLVLGYHINMDLAREKKLGKYLIGTTGRGIGPTYEDKVARRGITVGDLFNEDLLSQKLKNNIDYYNFQLNHYYNYSTVKFDDIFLNLIKYKDILLSKVKDIPYLLNYYNDTEPKNILFEGAQGALLDLDHGTFPYVTSSNTTIGGVFTGSGVNLNSINCVLGIFKAYCTRVGSGPFPTELTDELNSYFVDKGKEIGSTTGRRRRTGWLDLVLLSRMVSLNSVSSLCLTKIDVFDGLSEFKVCIGYQNYDDLNVLSMSSSVLDWNSIRPVYKVFSGWKTSLLGITKFSDLPTEAKYYIHYIENFVGVPINIISTGPDRSSIIMVRDIIN